MRSRRPRLRSARTGTSNADAGDGAAGTAPGAVMAAARAADSAGVSVPVVRADVQGATAESSLPGVKAEHGAEAAAKLRGVRVHINAASGSAVQPGVPYARSVVGRPGLLCSYVCCACRFPCVPCRLR